MSHPKSLDIYIDGAAPGNPGRAGIGVVICAGGHTLKNISLPIGVQTNNVAEYAALVAGLQEALVMKARFVRVFSDSELLCRQMRGDYRVKNSALKNLHSQAIRMIRGFDTFSINQIPREQNKGADKLARLGAKKNPVNIDGIAARNAQAREESPSSMGQRSGQEPPPLL